MLNPAVAEAYFLLKSCALCPRHCGIDRTSQEKGFCGMGSELMISSFGPHFGEEPELVGRYGSGTIFLTGCNLKCVFCQNYEISHLASGYKVSIDNFVDIMLRLQNLGCHNINFVTPTHFAPHIMQAIVLARERGLTIPIVYNCGGYESLKVIKLLEGFVDIYMPDIKFLDPELAEKYCRVKDYPEVVKKILKEMYRQVGDLVVDEDGIAQKGLLVRHLVMPNAIANTEKVIKFVAEELSPHTYLNIMAQYYPCYHAFHFSDINRRLSQAEYEQALELARKYNLTRF